MAFIQQRHSYPKNESPYALLPQEYTLAKVIERNR
jgi:hypothetical protein